MSINSNNGQYNLVLLCTEQNINNVLKYYEYYKDYIEFKKIIVIGPQIIENVIKNKKNDICVIDEDSIYQGMTYKNVKELIHKRVPDGTADNRTGWYFQQFLKMAYSQICEEDDYLVWDADTIPIKTVLMKNKAGKRIFHTKEEYNKTYFDTMHRLNGDLNKLVNESFISEHMLINCIIMSDLIRTINQNNRLMGESFWEKIIYAIDENEIKGSGFSEFETYGTFVSFKYKGMYVNENWYSLREGTVFFGDSINFNQTKMLSKKFDAVSFEKHNIHILMSKFLNKRCFQNLGIISMYENTKALFSKIKNKI